MATIAIVQCTVSTLGLTVSAKLQQVVLNDCWSLYKLYCVPSVLWVLMLEQQCNRFGRMTAGNYRHFAVYRLFFWDLLLVQQCQT